MNKNVTAIILAAGKGVRMKSQLPKVLHSICARPMLAYTLDLVKELKIKNSVAILGYKHKAVRKLLPEKAKVAVQKRLLGTADALKSAGSLLKNSKGTLLILYADHPLFTAKTIAELIRQHLNNRSDVTLLTARVDSPAGYGRIIRDARENICGIVEDNQADDFQKEIKEVNLGAICINKSKLFSVIRQIRPDNPKKEYYLTSAIRLLYEKEALIESLKIPDTEEAMGINSYFDLTKAERIMRMRINQNLTKQGVRIVDPYSTFIDWDVKIGENTVIYPFTVIETGVKIGKRCSIGPFCHLRPGTIIKNQAMLGNFVELVRSHVGHRTLIKHFSYLGDARIGNDVNIGAGSVTANYDGKNKHRSVIKDKAFIGSDTVLIAPVKIGRSAVTGANSAITKNKNVPDNKVAVGVPAKILNQKRGRR